MVRIISITILRNFISVLISSWLHMIRVVEELQRQEHVKDMESRQLHRLAGVKPLQKDSIAKKMD